MLQKIHHIHAAPVVTAARSDHYCPRRVCVYNNRSRNTYVVLLLVLEIENEILAVMLHTNHCNERDFLLFKLF